jgi:hypothetical protein
MLAFGIIIIPENATKNIKEQRHSHGMFDR